MKKKYLFATLIIGCISTCSIAMEPMQKKFQSAEQFVAEQRKIFFERVPNPEQRNAIHEELKRRRQAEERLSKCVSNANRSFGYPEDNH